MKNVRLRLERYDISSWPDDLCKGYRVRADVGAGFNYRVSRSHDFRKHTNFVLGVFPVLFEATANVFVVL